MTEQAEHAEKAGHAEKAEPDEEPIRYEKRGAVAVVTLNRPRYRNARRQREEERRRPLRQRHGWHRRRGA